MAYTAHKDPEKLKERFESLDMVESKAQTLADWILNAKHFITFTGAGISTSAGIPDFRGPEGVWTLRAQNKQRTSKTISSLQAIPTPTHMALVELQNRGLLKYLVSQNCDGLHQKSGILPDKISELHGNSKENTARTAEKNIFVTFVPWQHTKRAFESIKLDGNAESVEGICTIPSSILVNRSHENPSNELLSMHKKRICRTPLDGMADLRVYSKTDELMRRVMDKVRIPIPEFILHRRLMVELVSKEDARHQVLVYGVDVDGTLVTFLRSVKFNNGVSPAEPHEFNFRGTIRSGMQLSFDLEFMGHYNEPNLKLVHIVKNPDGCKTEYLLDYNPMTGVWKVRGNGVIENVLNGTGDDVVKDKKAKMKPVTMADGFSPDRASLADNIQ
ncbi:hypothetical protein R1sor_025095 [Riccia sorocarpa]|uniref:protein acetyllysine N-acetyltransferase n=1 Tax=Riccia sorocarpa TaxID=122646 RepID=A0ABD3G956_9MARC